MINFCKHCQCLQEKTCPYCKKNRAIWKKEMGLSWGHYLYLRNTWKKLQRFKMISTGNIHVDQQLIEMFGKWRKDAMHCIVMDLIIGPMIKKKQRKFNLGRYQVKELLQLKNEMDGRNLSCSWIGNMFIVNVIGEQKCMTQSQ